MKLRIVFLKRKYIYYTVIGIALLVLIIVLLALGRSPSTFTMAANSKAKKLDLTGDGKSDLLYIKTDKDKYMIEVNTNDENITLKTDKALDTLGNFYNYWPMRVTLLDLNRDKIPEIIVQSSNKNKPLQHIFLWNGNDFSDIFCSTNNIIGFIDSQNNKTPKMACGLVDQNKLTLSYYYFSNNKLKNFTYDDKTNFMGKNTVQAFINYIQTLPYGEANKPVDIFYPGMSGKDISIIGKLSGDNNTYVFQDCIFKDTKWDNAGKPTEIKWTLNFKGTSLTKNDDIKNYTLDIILKPDPSSNADDECYKIYSMNLQ
jgi:hypothetical protein